MNLHADLRLCAVFFFLWLHHYIQFNCSRCLVHRFIYISPNSVGDIFGIFGNFWIPLEFAIMLSEFEQCWLYSLRMK